VTKALLIFELVVCVAGSSNVHNQKEVFFQPLRKHNKNTNDTF